MKTNKSAFNLNFKKRLLTCFCTELFIKKIQILISKTTLKLNLFINYLSKTN